MLCDEDLPAAEMTPAESRLREAVENGYPHHTLTIEDGRGLVAEFDRLRERQFNADMCLDAVTEARRVLREHFGGNLAFLDDDLVRGVVKMKEGIDRLTRERDEAQSERDAMAKDADRYRWLRNERPLRTEGPAICDEYGPHWQLLRTEHIDARVDAALAQIEQERSEQVKEDTK